MAWMALGLFLLLIAPVRAGARVQWDEKGLRGAVGVMVWGLRGQIDVRGARAGEGGPRLTAAFRGKTVKLPRRKKRTGMGLKLLRLMLKSNGKGAALRRAVRVRTLEVFLRLWAMDAAALALGAGALRALGGAVPALRFRCVPDLGGKSGLRAVCIAEARLGILLAAWIIWKRGQGQS